MRLTMLFMLLSLCFCSSSYAVSHCDPLKANAEGRCWRVFNKDTEALTGFASGVALRITSVSGSGLTNDSITYELLVKFDFDKATGEWDESKTRSYVGTGEIYSTARGCVRFKLLVDTEDSTEPVMVRGKFHPGNSSSEFDDRIAISLPSIWLGSIPLEDPCETDVQVLENGSIDTLGY